MNAESLLFLLFFLIAVREHPLFRIDLQVHKFFKEVLLMFLKVQILFVELNFLVLNKCMITFSSSGASITSNSMLVKTSIP